jgi:hypothetical protein
LWAKSYQYLTLVSRLRTEQRFVEHEPKPDFRIRQMFKINVPLRNHYDWSFVASDEFFWQKNNSIDNVSHGFDQNRLFLGIGYNITTLVAAEAGYMNQYIHRINSPDFLSNIALLSLSIKW